MNIIKFPKYTNNYSCKWSNYEKSYLNKNFINKYIINYDTMDCYKVEYEKIIKIKNNFYKMDENIVLSKLFKKLNCIFLEKYKEEFNQTILNFITSEKTNSIVHCFLNTLKYDKDQILFLTDSLEEYFKGKNFLNNLKIVNQILIEIEKIDTNGEIINTINKNICKSLLKLFINFIKNTNLNVISNLFKKINLFKKFYNFFEKEEKLEINLEILNKIINNLDKGNILNNDYANIIIEIFSILKSYNLNELLNIECNLLLDYLNASIYYWILENNYNNIESLIVYVWNFLPKITFLEYYKIHLQNRALIQKNYEIENKSFNKISEIYGSDEYRNFIYELKYIIDDIYISNLCNNEIKNLNVNVKYNFKNEYFNLKKYNLLICSNNLWNNNRNLYDNIKYVDTIEVNNYILKKFYESKYNKKRKLNISYEESIIDINLWKNRIIMPLSYYNVFYKIGDNDISKNTFEFLRESLNYDEDYLLNILKIFKSKNLISEFVILNEEEIKNYINIYYENGDYSYLELINCKNVSFSNIEELSKIVFNYISFNNLEFNGMYKFNIRLVEIFGVKENIIYVINENLENQNINLNLISIKKDEKKVIEKIEYDKNLLLDSKTCELLKKEKELKYGKFLLNLRNNISKFFIPSEKEILARLERLIILGYIEKENDLYKYVE